MDGLATGMRGRGAGTRRARAWLAAAFRPAASGGRRRPAGRWTRGVPRARGPGRAGERVERAVEMDLDLRAVRLGDGGLVAAAAEVGRHRAGGAAADAL